MPYHVVYLVHSLGGGGTENGVVNLLNRLDASRFRFTLVLLQGDRDLLHRVQREGLDVIVFPRRRGPDPTYVLRFAKLLRRLAPDLLHTRGYSCLEGLAAGRLARVPAIVHSEHGREVEEALTMRPRRAFLRSLLYPLADVVATVSEELGHWLAAQVRVPTGRLLHLPNGVDVARFDPRPERRAARAALGLDPDARWVGSLGRLDPVKDYGCLLRAFARLGAEFADARLVLVGDGTEREALESAAHDLRIADRVVFPGWRDELPAYLAAMDVFVLPSRTEGMSNALLEAMAAALPCVATDVGGNHELIADGATGYLVSLHDPDAMTTAMAELLADGELRRRLGDAARRRTEDHFTLGAMVARYEDLYVGLMQKGGRSEPQARGTRRAAAAVPA